MSDSKPNVLDGYDFEPVLEAGTFTAFKSKLGMKAKESHSIITGEGSTTVSKQYDLVGGYFIGGKVDESGDVSVTAGKKSISSKRLPRPVVKCLRME